MLWDLVVVGARHDLAKARPRATSFARTLLFGVAPQDPVTLVTAVVVLLIVVVAASWLPARRASLIEPARAMRI